MKTIENFSQITNLYKFAITLKLKTPLHIGGNQDDGLTSDLPIMKTADGRPYIPGSSLKGILRSASERLSHLLTDEKPSCFLENGGCRPQEKKEIERTITSGDEEKAFKQIYSELCPICQTYGGGSISSKVKVNHVYFDGETKTRVREGIKINRETGTVEGGALFNYEYIQPGIQFTIEVEAENLTETNKKVLALAFAQFKQNLLRIGGLQARGLGEVEFVEGTFEEVNLSSDFRKESIAYLLGMTHSNQQKELDLFLRQSLLEEGGQS